VSNESSDELPVARRILIVGGVAAGATAAARARRIDERAHIVVLEKDPHTSFANCGLPYYLGGEIAERDALLVAPVSKLRGRLNLDVRTRHEVLSIDRQARRVRVRDRDDERDYELDYDALILATGASPIVPDIPGADAGGCFSLRNLEDTDAIDAWRRDHDVQRAVVVGGGYIGLEMAEQLHRRGVRVELIERGPQVLSLMDPEMVVLLEQQLTDHGVGLRLRSELTGVDVDDDGKVRGVRLDDGGHELPAQLVIFGIGVRPMTRLAEDAGLELGDHRGIRIDEHARTSDPAIWAAGDAVEYPYAPLGKLMRVPLAGPANRAGRVAGHYAAGGAEGGTVPEAADDSEAHSGQTSGGGELRVPPVMGTAVLRVFDLTAATTGLSLGAAKRQGLDATAVHVIAKHHVGYFPGAKPITLKLVYERRTGRVLGAQAVGEAGADKRIDVIATAMRFGATAADLIELDLCYAPPYGAAKDPVHMAAFAACNELDGLVRVVQPDADLSGMQVVDVRSAKELADDPLPGVEDSHYVHIPLEQLRERAGEVDPDLPTVTSCASGLRSYNAARILKQVGVGEVYNLSGAATLRRRAAAKGLLGGDDQGST
jgi:NADPH-dependent 2,4-dienoyl-CoA reductase/sulfur reductase-like enzyme/rhodanese-related sulfurtransferase